MAQSSGPVPPAPPSSLGVLGFDAQQEALYRLLLRGRASTVEELAALAGIPLPAVRQTVTRFVGAGLAELDGERIVARPPDEALSQLVEDEARRLQSRRDELDAVRSMLPALAEEHLAWSAPRGAPTAIERIEDVDVSRLLRGLSAESAGDLLWLRPDPWNVAPRREIDGWVADLISSGRRSRAIYPVQILERAPEIIRRRAEAGEHVRILAVVPTRLAVLGDSAVLIAERFDVFDSSRLVLRQHSLIAAMTLLFENLWEKAMAVPGLDGQRHDDRVRAQRLLLGQLAGGAKDEQIARTLGISLRTVRRRVAELLEELGASSRFQAGVEAVRRGWM